MHRYAHLNDENEVVGIYQLHGEVDRADYVQSETAELRQIYDAASEEFSNPQIHEVPTYTIADQVIEVNGNQIQPFAGSYYCQPGDSIKLQGNITDEGKTVTAITVPVTLKMPLIRHANSRPTQDEIYLNVTLQNGVLTAIGTIPWSGDWKIIIERNNEAIQRIGANWKLQHADITFLA